MPELASRRILYADKIRVGERGITTVPSVRFKLDKVEALFHRTRQVLLVCGRDGSIHTVLGDKTSFRIGNEGELKRERINRTRDRDGRREILPRLYDRLFPCGRKVDGDFVSVRNGDVHDLVFPGTAKRHKDQTEDYAQDAEK